MFEKDLKVMVKEIEVAAEIRKATIKDKIEIFDQEEAELNREISEEVQNLVTYELREDKDNLDKINKKIEELRKKADIVKNKKESFLIASIDIKGNKDDLKKLKVAALKHRSSRLKRIEAIKNRQNEIRKLLKDIKIESNQLYNENLNLLVNETELRIMKPILRYIDPKCADLDHDIPQETFLNNWLMR